VKVRKCQHDSVCETEMYSRLNNESFSNETSDDENTKETTYQLTSTPVSAESYGSTPVRDQPFLWLYIPWCAVVYYVMAFFGFFCAMLIRQGLSVAIVAMVNQTAVAGDTTVTNVSEDECPRDPELIHEGGEFNWDRNQQGVVLAAFFYGHGVLQVCIMNTCLCLKTSKSRPRYRHHCEGQGLRAVLKNRSRPRSRTNNLEVDADKHHTSCSAVSFQQLTITLLGKNTCML